MQRTITSLNEYEKLYEDYVVRNRVRGYSNFFINKSNLPEYIALGKVKYEIIDGSLFIIVDEGCFYKLYFCGLTHNVDKLPIMDKPVCCDIYEQQEHDIHIEFIHDLLSKNGFRCQQKYEQVRLFYGLLHKASVGYLNKNKKKLSRFFITVNSLSIDDKDVVEDMIEKNMGKYNKLSIEDDVWDEQIKNNNIIGLFDCGNLIALYYYTPKASRIIVDKRYRGKNLSVLLRMYFASQKRWQCSTKNHYDWAEADNIPSKRTFEKLLAIYTGKVKYRYVANS